MTCLGLFKDWLQESPSGLRSVDCDKALCRIMCYVRSTLDYKMSGFVADSIDKCNLWLFADSDHAGEHDNRSTSGVTWF